MTSDEKYIATLEARINNLEIALHAVVAVTMDLQPPDTQRQLKAVINDHFYASNTLGGCAHPGGYVSFSDI